MKKSLRAIFKYQRLLLVTLFMFPLVSFSQGEYTRVARAKLYSEYYSNSNAPFKGTIIFQNGSGTDLTEWTKNKDFFNCIKKLGKVFIYDRSGLGKSPADLSLSFNNPMTAELINKKLLMLLKKRHIKPPYILVAHSYGGMYAGYFARKYPSLVKGILMIDPVPSNYKWTTKFLNQYKIDMRKMRKLSTREAYTQYSYAKANQYNTMPAQLFFQLIGFEETKKQINELPALSNRIPIIILSSTYMEKNAPIQGDWYKLQQQWLNKNSNSEIIQVKSGHFIQLQHPKLVCKELQRIMRTHITMAYICDL